jgi:glyoxylase-like metal-dependent hydrolase (beta-lactamase superfamily II)
MASHRICILLSLLAGCAVSSHATQRSTLGTPSRSSQMLVVMDTPGPIELETLKAADWVVERAGLINLHDPKAKAAGLKSGLEPAQIYFHVLRHPKFGVFIVDTGVERALRDQPQQAAIRGLVASYLKFEQLKNVLALGDWLAKQGAPLAGVFMTHLHLDHVSGMPDVPHGTPIYAGPGETRAHAASNLFVRPNIDRALAGQNPISEWQFVADPDGRFAGVIDVFGDGSLWALHTPGHTAGSTAYLVRTPSGPVLLTGDTSHTVWGWTHDVEPGDFTADHAANRQSLERLRRLAREHPNISVRLGHQQLPATP